MPQRRSSQAKADRVAAQYALGCAIWRDAADRYRNAYQNERDRVTALAMNAEGERSLRMEIDGRQVADDGYDWFQRRFKGIEAGDVFSLPLPSGGFAFGRVMNAHDGAQIAEYFRHWQEDDAFSDEIVRSGRLFAPIGLFISGIAYRNRKRPWKVIHKDPGYYPDELYDIQFLAASGYKGAYQYYTLRDIGKFYGAVSKEERDNELVCSLMPQHPGMIANLIEKLMRASGLLGLSPDLGS